MPKHTTTFRYNDMTKRQIEQLQAHMGDGTTRTEVITTAIDRMAREERQNMTHEQLRQRLNDLGIRHAQADNATLNGIPAVIVRWNGKEEWYTGPRNGVPEYEEWLAETYADDNIQ